MDMLAQIETPPGPRAFTAGLTLEADVVVEAAPIIRYMVGWSRARVRAHCHSKGWSVLVVQVGKRLLVPLPGDPARHRVGTACGVQGRTYLEEDRADEAFAKSI